jgi:CMP/dCMP kinase
VENPLETKAPVVAIDGPAASGKGTVATRLAQKLNWHCLDSGKIYRFATFLAITRLQEPFVESEIAILLDSCHYLSFNTGLVYFEGRDITSLLYDPGLGRLVPQIAALPKVRSAVSKVQQSFRKPPGLVAEGRDMAVCFSDAILKIYLTADPKIRAQRRFAQLPPNSTLTLKEVYHDILKRDQADSNRAASPLEIHPDALVLDNSTLSVEEVVAKLLSLITTPALLIPS